MRGTVVKDRFQSKLRNAQRQSTVLLIEDHQYMAEVLTELLEQAGYAIRWATTAHEAKTIARDEEIDLIILDLILPDVDGLILCSDLRRMRDVPIVVVSGTNRKRDAVLSLRLGADDFVHKPFDLSEFEERIRTVMRRAA